MSAKETLDGKQKIIFLILALLYTAFLVVNFRLAIISILAFLTLFYLINIFISAYFSYKSLFSSKEVVIDPDETKKDKRWPRYSILCPLYKEANILPDFVERMEQLDYPKENLECLLLLEEDDIETINAAKRMNLPAYFKIVIVPDSYPKTKPKACNFGLESATGDFVVIYDAEDQPDPDQLKKAVLAFEKSDRTVGCVQAKLNFYNGTHNFLTRMFTSEYTFWFDYVLPGFQSADVPIPLGGTSNHFIRAVLSDLNGWDPYNVTEDCDLGLRLKKAGYRTVILDSHTLEEANANLGNWIRQRSRWIKGYFQTFLVHLRQPVSIIKKIGFFNFLVFFLVAGFLPIASLINPFLWLTTILYFALRSTLGPVIEDFYPNFILIPAVFCLFVGNFFFVYNFLLGSAKKNMDTYTKFGLLMPIYWLLISIAGWYGLVQLLIKPHFWEKTKHGLTKVGA